MVQIGNVHIQDSVSYKGYIPFVGMFFAERQIYDLRLKIQEIKKEQTIDEPTWTQLLDIRNHYKKAIIVSNIISIALIVSAVAFGILSSSFLTTGGIWFYVGSVILDLI